MASIRKWLEANGGEAMKNVLNFPGEYSAVITYGFQAKGSHLGYDEALVTQVKIDPGQPFLSLRQNGIGDNQLELF